MCNTCLSKGLHCSTENVNVPSTNSHLGASKHNNIRHLWHEKQAINAPILLINKPSAPTPPLRWQISPQKGHKRLVHCMLKFELLMLTHIPRITAYSWSSCSWLSFLWLSFSQSSRITWPDRWRQWQCLTRAIRNQHWGVAAELSSATCLQFIFVHQTSNFNLFFSMSSIYPGCKIDVPLAHSSNVISDIDQLSDTNGGETEIESKSDWLTKPQPPVSGSRVSVLAHEVCF